METLLERLRHAGEDGADVTKMKALVEAFWQKEFKRLNESEWDESKSNLYQHALHELKAAGLFDEDSDYKGMLGNAVLEIVKMFAKQGHSGFSAGMAVQLLEKLLRFEHLTPITDNPADWFSVSEYMGNTGKGYWQCKRNPALFSEDAGKTYYHVDKRDEIMTSEKAKE